MTEFINDMLKLIERIGGIVDTIIYFCVVALLLGNLPESYAKLATALHADDKETLQYVSTCWKLYNLLK